MPKNLTSGTPWKVIVIFAIPLLLGNIVQQMYQVIDAMVVGQHLGVNSLGAVGTTGALLFLLMGFAWGMTTGFAIPTAQAFGAGDLKAVRLSVAAGTILTAVTSVLVTVIGCLFARDLLILLRTPAELLDQATTFAVVSFAGSVTMLFFNYLAAIIRAKGDSRTPLVFLVISCVLNVGLVILFVQYMGFGVGGAAGATVLSQLLSVLLCLAYVRRSIPEFRVRPDEWLESRVVIAEHLRIGLPTGFQASIIAIGALAVQVRLNLLGPDAVAAYTTAARVDGLSVAILQSLGLAVATFAAQNFGAKLSGRIMIGVRQGQIMAIGTGVLLGLVVITFGQQLILLFIGSGHSDIMAMAHQYLIVNGASYFVLGLLFVNRSALQGLGHVLVPTICGVLELSMRVIAAIVLAEFMGFLGVAISSPLAWIGAVVMLIPAWRKAKKGLEADVERAAARRERADFEANSEPADGRVGDEPLCVG